MILLLLIVIPLFAGILTYWSRQAAKNMALAGSLLVLLLAVYVTMSCGEPESWSMPWIPALGARLSVAADGMALMLCLLTALVYPVVLLVNRNKEIANPAAYYSLIMLSQAGLMGVFLASDALLFISSGNWR